MNLATIEKVIAIDPIEGADRIDVASVLGYKSVVKKGEFKVGDQCVFIKPDTLVPRKPWNQFLWKDENPAGPPIRLRCAKFRRQVSEGLTLPLIHGLTSENIKEGDDVTGLLEIVRYEKPVPAQLRGKILGNFPFFIPKTDSERLQSNPKLLEEIRDLKLVTSLKVNGTSATFFIKGGEFGVCSRNLQLKEEEGNAYWDAAKKYNIEQCLRDTNRDLAIQGEVYGPGINGNDSGAPTISLQVFDIWDIEKRAYLDMEEAFLLCTTWAIPTVKYVTFVHHNTIANFVGFTNTLTYDNGFPVEGIVCKPQKERFSEALRGRLQFKVISETHMLKKGE